MSNRETECLIMAMSVQCLIMGVVMLVFNGRMSRSVIKARIRLRKTRCFPLMIKCRAARILAMRTLGKSGMTGPETIPVEKQMFWLGVMSIGVGSFLLGYLLLMLGGYCTPHEVIP